MQNIIETISLPIIAALTVALFEAFKSATGGKFNKYIPLLAPFVGAALGALVFLALPEYLPAANAGAAAVLGSISGLSATGAHQVKKQIGKGGDDDGTIHRL